jgi:hypothetical protein
MLAQGVVVAHITDPTGNVGVAGIQLEHVNGTGNMENFPPVTDGTYYVSADLTTAVDASTNANAATTSSGLIIRLNAGGAAEYTAGAAATPGVGFEQHLNGSRAGTVLEVFFRQCASHAQEGCP